MGCMTSRLVEVNRAVWRPEDVMDSVKKPLPPPAHNHMTHTLANEPISITQTPQETWDFLSKPINRGPY